MAFDHRPTSIFPFYKLESDTSALSNEDTESVNSLQEHETGMRLLQLDICGRWFLITSF